MREGAATNPHDHHLLKIIEVAAKSGDGSEMISIPVNQKFQKGLLIAMSNDKTFHLYAWETLPEDI